MKCTNPVYDILVVSQHSKIGNKILEGQRIVSPSKYVWADTGEVVTYPIPLNTTRKRIYIKPQYAYRYTFAELCEMFPNAVVKMTEDSLNNTNPDWGTGWYIEKQDDGYCNCLKANWDTSG